MKKASLFIVLLAFSPLLKAQVSAGPKVGLNFSNVTGGVNDANNKFKLGFYAGFFLNFAISDEVYIQPEALYSTRGFKLQRSIGTKDTNVTHNFSYIDFPFLVGLNLSENAFLEGGPQIGYLINDKSKGTITVSSNVQNVDTGNVYGFKTTEYSFVVGGGYRFNFGLVASMRFTYGLTKVYDNADFSHNMSMGVTIGYSFGANGLSGSGVIYKRL